MEKVIQTIPQDHDPELFGEGFTISQVPDMTLFDFAVDKELAEIVEQDHRLQVRGSAVAIGLAAATIAVTHRIHEVPISTDPLQDIAPAMQALFIIEATRRGVKSAMYLMRGRKNKP